MRAQSLTLETKIQKNHLMILSLHYILYIVRTLKDTKLSELLQLYANIILEKAITMVRQSEKVSEQQAELGKEEDKDLKIEAVHKEAGYKQELSKKSEKERNYPGFQKNCEDKSKISCCMRWKMMEKHHTM